jgi:superfamily II DNA or RNA helicase
MRPYQRECIDLVVAGNNHGIFAQSTNSGKTLEAIAISESLRCKTLFMVDRVELLDQTFKKFKRYGTQTVGIINPQNFEPRMITIGMQQTIYSHLKNKMTREETLEYLNTVQLLFVDECHKISSTTGRYCLRHIVNAYYRYGLSGTPLTEDLIRNMYLIGYLGRILQKVSNKDLIDNGYSADPIVNIVSYPTTRISTLSEYSAVYTEGIVKNEERNKAIVEIIKQYKSKSILVVVRHLEHGRLIEKELEETGYFVSGQDTKSDRLWIYNKFSDKKIPIVIASMIYKEGIDIDAIDVLIYAAGEKAPITILQVIGRGLRKRIDKDVLIFYDFEDKGHYYLQRHTTQRKKIYHKEGWKLIRYDKEKYKCNHLEAVA